MPVSSDHEGMSCGEWITAISAQADGEDPGVDPRLLAAHLDSCASCRSYRDQVAGLRRAVGGGPRRRDARPLPQRRQAQRGRRPGQSLVGGAGPVGPRRRHHHRGVGAGALRRGGAVGARVAPRGRLQHRLRRGPAPGGHPAGPGPGHLPGDPRARRCAVHHRGGRRRRGPRAAGRRDRPPPRAAERAPRVVAGPAAARPPPGDDGRQSRRHPRRCACWPRTTPTPPTAPGARPAEELALPCSL